MRSEGALVAWVTESTVPVQIPSMRAVADFFAWLPKRQIRLTQRAASFQSVL